MKGIDKAALALTQCWNCFDCSHKKYISSQLNQLLIATASHRRGVRTK